MTDELLPYYEKELAFIRQMGAEFAADHPKIAGRLGVNADAIEDPHVSRLIESFAYLNARIQHKLDDDFPELTDAMLGVVFPHYQRPLPSMSILQFEPDPESLDGLFRIERGTQLESQSFQGKTARFQTAYPVELLPLRVASAKLVGRPFVAPAASEMQGAGAVLHLRLKSTSTEIALSEVRPDRIRFYLKGQSQHVNPLYQMLLRDCVNVVLTKSEDDLQPVFLGRDAIKPVGFGSNEGLLPYPHASFIGYRLVTEFFTYPEKFMFIDIEGLAERIAADANQELNLYIYLRETDIELERNISEQTFALGCTPIINLFKQKAEPIHLEHTQSEYQIVPDAQHPDGYEVYSVDNVNLIESGGERHLYLPFYGINHRHTSDNATGFWHAARRESTRGGLRRDDGTEVYISLVDLNFNPETSDSDVLEIETTCTNRDIPAKLPFGIDQPKLNCVDSAPPTSAIRCLTQPSATVRPPLRNHARWRLISHLNLNHLSLTGGEEATVALKEILRLYDFKDSAVTRAMIEAIVSVHTTTISAPITVSGRATLCRGTEVHIVLDDSMLSGTSPYLYASVLEKFFALYCSINSFTRVIATLKGKEGILKKCPPQAGEKTLL